MRIFFVLIKTFLLIIMLLGLGACATETTPSTMANSYYVAGPNSQFTDNMLTMPNAYTYSRPIQFGHVDIHANDIYSPVYQAPLAIYPH